MPLDYNPLAVASSYNPPKIFQGLTDLSYDYQLSSAGSLIVGGFSYAGLTAQGTGKQGTQTIIGVDNFKKGWSLGVEAQFPLDKSGNAKGGLGLNYGEIINTKVKNTDIIFNSSQRNLRYDIALTDLDQVVLARNFVRDVVEVNDLDSATSFIEKYGTHYPTNVTYGGVLNRFASIEETDFYKSESKELDLKASFELNQPGEQTTKLKDPKTITTSGSPESSNLASGSLSFSQVEEKEARDILGRSKMNFTLLVEMEDLVIGAWQPTVQTR